MPVPALHATEMGALFAGHVGMCWSEAVAATLCLFCNSTNKQPSLQMLGLQVIVPAEHASASVNNVSLAGTIKSCLETNPALRPTSWQVNENLSLLKIENGWW